MTREKITYDQLVEMYEEVLNCEGDVTIGCLTFEPAMILRELDSIAYWCGLDDYYDSICEEYFCEHME